jgi:hypothetical protein
MGTSGLRSASNAPSNQKMQRQHALPCRVAWVSCCPRQIMIRSCNLGFFSLKASFFLLLKCQCHFFLSARTHPAAELSLAPAELQLVLHAMLYFTADIYIQPAQPQPDDGMRQQQHRQHLHHFLGSPLCVCGGLGQGGLASSCPSSAALSPSCLSRAPPRR